VERHRGGVRRRFQQRAHHRHERRGDHDLSSHELTGIANIDGGAGNDIITGSAGNDTIIGGTGADVLNSGGGNDVFLVGPSAGIDTINGTAAGYDTIRASANGTLISFGTWTDVDEVSAGTFSGVRIVGTTAGNLMNLNGLKLTGITAIDGGAGNDTITGSSGADTIIGGVGGDRLDGGAGADRFVYNAATESRGTTIDRIFNFVDVDGAEDDVIDLSPLGGSSVLSFIGSSAFTGSLGEVRVDTTTAGITRILIDLDGNRIADMEIQLDGHFGDLKADDFLL
jgi:Ca2+-binding RTX toxin-like protein